MNAIYLDLQVSHGQVERTSFFDHSKYDSRRDTEPGRMTTSRQKPC